MEEFSNRGGDSGKRIWNETETPQVISRFKYKV
jgi:hypothetical protein